MRARTYLWVLAVTTSLCLSSIATADQIAISDIDRSTGIAPSAGSVGDWLIGWSFTPTEDVKVTALGVFDFDNNGVLVTNTDVGIWRQSDASLITSATVAANGPLSGECVWATPASQVTLQANTAYVIASRTYAGIGERYIYDSASATVAPQITFGDSVGETASAFVMPVSFPDCGYGFIGPNFKFEAVPEPMTVSLLGLGSLAMLGRRRKK